MDASGRSEVGLKVLILKFLPSAGLDLSMNDLLLVKRELKYSYVLLIFRVPVTYRIHGVNVDP